MLAAKPRFHRAKQSHRPTRQRCTAQAGSQAEAIVQAVESRDPPHRLLLGNDAYDGAMAKLDELRANFTEWEWVSRGPDFPRSKSSSVGLMLFLV